MKLAQLPPEDATLGVYHLLGRIGQGGMGTVYLGRSPQGRLVAIKVVRADLRYDDEFRRRFRSEVNRARQVPPFCTAEVLDADPDHDPPYLVVEYVDGKTLAEVVNDQGPLSGSALHSVAVGTATALAAIHGARVIHRDFKPANVLLAVGGVKVIDFGIARPLEITSAHTRTDQLVGTVDYMAPERFDTSAGHDVGPAADIFAWGAVIGYAATGRTPFGAESPPATAIRILTQTPDLRGLSGPLHDLVRRALAKDPRDRPTAQDLLTSLVTGSSPTSTTETNSAPPAAPPRAWSAPPEPTKRPAPRRTARMWAVAGSAVAVLAAAALLLAYAVNAAGRNPPLDAATVPSRAAASQAAATGAAAGSTAASAAPTGSRNPASASTRSTDPAAGLTAIFAGARKTLIYVPRIDRYVTLPLRTDATVSDSTEREAVFTLFPIGGTTYMLESTTPSTQQQARCVGVNVRRDEPSTLRATECSSRRQMLFEITSTGQADQVGRPTYLITSDFYGEVSWDEDTLRLSVGERDTGTARTAFSFVDHGAV